MDRSIRFYTEVLGLRLTNRFGNDWATVSAGEGLTIGIHPASTKYPPPGTKGAIILGLDLDVSMERLGRGLLDTVCRSRAVLSVANPETSRTWKIQMAMRFTPGKRLARLIGIRTGRIFCCLIQSWAVSLGSPCRLQ